MCITVFWLAKVTHAIQRIKISGVEWFSACYKLVADLFQILLYYNPLLLLLQLVYAHKTVRSNNFHTSDPESLNSKQYGAPNDKMEFERRGLGEGTG